MYLLCSHHSATEKNTIERHRSVLKLLEPSSCEIRIWFFRSNRSRASNEGNVTASTDECLLLKDWVMERFN